MNNSCVGCKYLDYFDVEDGYGECVYHKIPYVQVHHDGCGDYVEEDTSDD